MPTPNFYAIEGVAGQWQFWAEAQEPDACWLTPATATAQALAQLASEHPAVQVMGQFALVPTALLSPVIATSQPHLF